MKFLLLSLFFAVHPPQRMSPVPKVVVLPPPAKTNFFIAWSDNETNVTGYEVWHSRDMVNWTMLTGTSNKFLAIPMTNTFLLTNYGQNTNDESIFVSSIFTNAADFFIVRATNIYGDKSDWWTK